MRAITRTICPFLAAATLMLTTAAAFAGHPPGHRVADGIEIYYAVLPAELIRGYPTGSAERRMHGGTPGGSHSHHVMIALFDAASAERITDAEVTATVAETGMSGITKTLEPMSASEVRTYGNYFYFTSLALYRITVAIRRPGSAEAVTASFDYTHH